jgi:hypothetical protein
MSERRQLSSNNPDSTLVTNMREKTDHSAQPMPHVVADIPDSATRQHDTGQGRSSRGTGLRRLGCARHAIDRNL